MRVVHVFKDCYPPTTGGIEQHMSLLCRRLSETADTIILAPSRSRRRMEETAGRVRIIRVPEFGRYASTPLCPTAAAELRRLRPDIVHLHFPNPMGDIAYLMGARKTPLAVTYHADIIKQKLFLPLYRPVLGLIFKNARRIIFSAPENIPLSSVPVSERAKCRVIPFGIEPEAFALREGEGEEVDALRAGAGGPIVLFVGAGVYFALLTLADSKQLPGLHGLSKWDQYTEAGLFLMVSCAVGQVYGVVTVFLRRRYEAMAKGAGKSGGK